MGLHPPAVLADYGFADGQAQPDSLPGIHRLDLRGIKGLENIRQILRSNALSSVRYGEYGIFSPAVLFYRHPDFLRRIGMLYRIIQ